MWRGVEADPESRLLQRGGNQRRDTSLAVGAGDMNGGKSILRITERCEERPGGLEPELDLGCAGEEERESLLVLDQAASVTG